MFLTCHHGLTKHARCLCDNHCAKYYLNLTSGFEEDFTHSTRIRNGRGKRWSVMTNVDGPFSRKYCLNQKC